MPDIVITEFMDEAAVETLARDHDTLYDPTLADRQEEIPALLGEARALVVRNRTQVRGVVLDAPKLKVVGRPGGRKVRQHRQVPDLLTELLHPVLARPDPQTRRRRDRLMRASPIFYAALIKAP